MPEVAKKCKGKIVRILLAIQHARSYGILIIPRSTAMRAILLLAVLTVAVPDRAPPEPKETPVAQQIVGEWQLVTAIVGGDPNAKNDAPQTVLIFTAKEIHVRENGKQQPNDDASYTLDATKKPVTIDIVPKRAGNKKIEGILKVEGDTLTLCFPFGGEGARPTNFVSAPNTQTALMHFKRLKK
jgi:uncharacterized protein (TIGR03067 family)